jgi:hypothetical protein
MIRLRRLKHITVFKKVLLTVGHVYSHIVDVRRSRPVTWDVVCPVKCRVLTHFPNPHRKDINQTSPDRNVCCSCEVYFLACSY